MLMTTREVQALTRADCLCLLATVAVGRLVFHERALPAVVPVPFVLDSGRVVLRAAVTTSLVEAVRGTVVVFQADDIDAHARRGWSITVTGRVDEVLDPHDLQHIASRPLLPWWTAGPGERVLAVPLELVDGRRLGTAPGAVGA
jgi:nitroimidazol reductase NimA-like FMN-containing flavoprotein (pyridoxamine 5'-phosphate oxidase superfamily)